MRRICSSTTRRSRNFRSVNKAYITQLSVMYLFAFELALAKETISTAECKRLVSALTKMPEAVQYVIDNCEDTCKFVATKLVATDSLLT